MSLTWGSVYTVSRLMLAARYEYMVRMLVMHTLSMFSIQVAMQALLLQLGGHAASCDLLFAEILYSTKLCKYTQDVNLQLLSRVPE